MKDNNIKTFRERLLELYSDHSILVKDICIQLGDISRFQLNQKLKEYHIPTRGKGNYRRPSSVNSGLNLPKQSTPNLELLEYDLVNSGNVPIRQWNLKKFPQDDRYFAYSDSEIHLYDKGVLQKRRIKDTESQALNTEGNKLGVSYGSGQFILIKK